MRGSSKDGAYRARDGDVESVRLAVDMSRSGRISTGPCRDDSRASRGQEVLGSAVLSASRGSLPWQVGQAIRGC